MELYPKLDDRPVGRKIKQKRRAAGPPVGPGGRASLPGEVEMEDDVDVPVEED